MRPVDLPLITTVSPPSLSPDGGHAFVAAQHPSFETDGYVGQVFRVALDGSEVRRVTRGLSDSAPQVSPDGRLLGFLRTAPGGAPQLAIVEASGGEPLVVTDATLGVSSFAFSPDSTRVAYLTRVPEDGRYGTLDEVSAASEDPRSFTGQRLHSNGLGWYLDRPAQIFVVDLPALTDEPPVTPIGRAAKLAAEKAKESGEESPNPLVPKPRRVTDDHHDWGALCFTPDGSALVAVRDDPRGEPNLTNVICRLDLDGGEPVLLTGVGGVTLSIQDVCVGQTTVFFAASSVGESGRDFIGHHAGVWAVNLAGATAPRLLTDPDVTVSSALAPVPGAEAVVFTDVFHGTGRVLRVDAGGVGEQLSDGEHVAQAVAAAGGVVVATLTTATSTGELAVVAEGTTRILTDFSQALREQTEIITPEEFIATGEDGGQVQGWVLTPSGPGPHPVLLTIHGGPYHAYDKAFFDEAQVYAGAGYAVVMCNPRGSWGYGTDHGRAVRGDLAAPAMSDVLAFLDQAVAAHDDLDGSRVGVMGGSYGGYLTAWIIAHDHRFAGAIVERGFLDPWSFNGSSDIGWFFGHEYTSYDKARADAQSPMLLTDQVRTPTLVLHSELDLRCPLHQGLQYYSQLVQAGVEAELLVFPGENHELTRSGTPWHRRQRFEKILQFWGRQLPVTDPS